MHAAEDATVVAHPVALVTGWRCTLVVNGVDQPAAADMDDAPPLRLELALCRRLDEPPLPGSACVATIVPRDARGAPVLPHRQKRIVRFASPIAIPWHAHGQTLDAIVRIRLLCGAARVTALVYGTIDRVGDDDRRDELGALRQAWHDSRPISLSDDAAALLVCHAAQQQ